MATRPIPLHEPQMGFDEQIVEDAELENALEERQRIKVLAGEHRKAFDEANEAANAEIAKLELPDGKAVRIGRFRIARSAVPARSVTFDTKPTSRVRISVIGEE